MVEYWEYFRNSYFRKKQAMYKEVLEGRENAFQWEISVELIKKKVKPV